MSKLLSALVGLSMLGLASAAGAAEPVTLSAAQLDSVFAGQSAAIGIGQFGLVNAAVLSTVIGIGSVSG